MCLSPPLPGSAPSSALGLAAGSVSMSVAPRSLRAAPSAGLSLRPFAAAAASGGVLAISCTGLRSSAPAVVLSEAARSITVAEPFACGKGIQPCSARVSGLGAGGAVETVALQSQNHRRKQQSLASTWTGSALHLAGQSHLLFGGAVGERGGRALPLRAGRPAGQPAGRAARPLPQLLLAGQLLGRAATAVRAVLQRCRRAGAGCRLGLKEVQNCLRRPVANDRPI